MVWLLAFDRLTVKAKAVVPGGVLRSEERRVGKEWRERGGWESSFWIVLVPTAFAIVVVVAPDRVKVKVSSSSNAVSAHTSTVTGLLVSPGAKVSVVLVWLVLPGVRVSLLQPLALPIAVTLPVA